MELLERRKMCIIFDRLYHTYQTNIKQMTLIKANGNWRNGL